MSNEITQEQMRKFAEAVGWQYDPDTETWHDPECTRWKEGMPCLLDCCDEDGLPDFLHSKDAVIEALEWFCETSGFIWNMKSCAIKNIDCWLKSLATGKEVAVGFGPTLNAAIILAVLKASESQQDKER